MELVWSVVSGVQVLKKYGGRQKMNLVLEGFFTVKFFIRSIPLDWYLLLINNILRPPRVLHL